MITTRRLVAALAVAAAALTGCSSSTGTNSPAVSAGAGPTSTAEAATSEAPLDSSALIIYNAQHENLTQAWADAFTAKTGIKVQLRNGDDLSMANQIVAEGAASPADVFITENSPGMDLVERAGLFAAVDKTTAAQIPPQYSPSTGKWVGVAARSTVLVYNPTKLTAADLPTSIMDLADPKYKGRWAASPSGADFQAIVAAMLSLKGEDATRTWLTAMKANSVAYKGNTTVMKAVNAGEVDSGVIYHYYWYGDQAETKENSANTKLHFFGHQDAGAFVSVSGAGILTSSTKQAQAQQFVAFITSVAGQDIVANTVLEYPLAGNTSETNKALTPLAQLDAPKLDPSTLDSQKVIDLMTEAGLL